MRQAASVRPTGVAKNAPQIRPLGPALRSIVEMASFPPEMISSRTQQEELVSTASIRYRNLVFDSARWEGFTFRGDDIVISTPAKCGTTWTQMICAL